MNSEFRHLPSVDKVLSDKRVVELSDQLPHDVLVDVAREVLEQARYRISRGKPPPAPKKLVDQLISCVEALIRPSLQPVINASGVLLHTNLGRAPMSKEAANEMERIAQGYCNLEFDTETGTRGSRNVHIERLLCQLTGAEAALVVNNNASAVLLALTALAKRKEVIVSRGQAVEIGGGFRIPDVMRQSGARLIEVGTTNCTYAADYENAVTPRTAALLRVHPSNFKVSGFTHEVSLNEMREVSLKYGLLLLDDLGSGCFMDVTQFGLAPEPIVQDSVALDTLVCFSGDKLVGGPQAGIIVGKKDVIDKLKKHPLARAVRIDKIRLGGLIVTIGHYLRGEAVTRIPIWRMISMPIDEIERRAETWARALPGQARVINGETMIGGGSVPGGSIPTKLVAIGGSDGEKSEKSANRLSQILRRQSPPVIGRIENDMLLLDPRTVLPEEDIILLKALRNICLS